MDNELPTFIEEPEFSKNVDRLLTEEQVLFLFIYLGQNPKMGDVIPGTDGCRKLRWYARGRGKRGGTRVIYFYRDTKGTIHLLTIYAKNENENEPAQEILKLRRRIKDD